MYRATGANGFLLDARKLVRSPMVLVGGVGWGQPRNPCFFRGIFALFVARNEIGSLTEPVRLSVDVSNRRNY
jgi:hypothetical protein